MKNIQAIFSLSILVVGLVAMGAAVSLHNVPTVHAPDVSVELGQGEVQPVEKAVNVELGEGFLGDNVRVEIGEVTVRPGDDGIKGGVSRKMVPARIVAPVERQGERVTPRKRSKCFWHTPSMGRGRVRVCDSNYIAPEKPQLTDRDYAKQAAEISVGFEGLGKE